MASKVKEIKERLDESRYITISVHRQTFNLGKIKEMEKTHSFVSKSKVFGREEEKQRMIKLLTN